MTILAEFPSRTPGITSFTLQYEPASVSAYSHTPVAERWGAIFYESNGTTGGRWFKTETEARALFEAWRKRES